MKTRLSKRVLSFAVTLAMVLTFIPFTLAANIPATYSADFEDQQLGRAGPREFGEKVAIATNPTKDAVNGSDYVIKVSDRGLGTPDPYAGVRFNISEFIDFRITIKAKVYMDGATNAAIKANLQQVAGGASQYATIATSTSGKGTWYEVTGSFDVPAYLDEAYLYFETSGTTNDFYVDDIEVVGSASQLVYADYSGLDSLKKLYSDYFKVGVASPYALVKSVDHSGLIKQQYNSLTSENEAKPENVIDIAACIAEPGKYNEAPAVKFNTIKKTLDFCKENGIAYRYHTLLWHSQTPEAFFHVDYDVNKPLIDKELLYKRMESYFKQVLQWCDANYPGVVYAVDVVNEALSGKPTTDGGWYRVVQSNEYVTKAFEFARKYAPSYMKLYYNDFGEAGAAKQQQIINLLRDAKKAGTIDGIGMQSHLQANAVEATNITNMKNHINALRIYADLGYEVQLTELDIMLPGSGTQDEKFAAQALAYKTLFEELVKARKEGYNISSVTIWAVSDNFSWKNWSPPVLFNADLSAKPAFTALATLGTEVKTADTQVKLTSALAELDTFDFTPYTGATVTALKAAITAAKAVLDDPDSTLVELEDALAVLAGAKAALTKTPVEPAPPVTVPEEPAKSGDSMPLAAVAVIFLMASGCAMFFYSKRKTC